MSIKFSEFSGHEIFLILLPVISGLAIRHFVYSTQNFFMNADSYYYIDKINDGIHGFNFMEHFGYLFGIDGLHHILIFLSIFSIIMFYYMCRQYTSIEGSFIATLLYSISPLIFFNTQFGMLDKNIPSIFMIIFIIAIMGRFKVWWHKLILLILSFSVFAFIWDGWIGMLAIVALYYIIKSIINKNYKILMILFFISIPSLYMAYNRFIRLAGNMNIKFISELNPVWNIGFFWEFIIIAIVWIFIITKIKLEKYDKNKIDKYLFVYVGFIFTFIVTCFVFRFNILFLPFLYLCSGIIFTDLEYSDIKKFLVLSLLIIPVFVFSTDIYMREPIMNQDIENAMDYVNTINDSNCIISNWDMGVIYDAYTNKSVVHRASAGSYEMEIDELVKGSNKSCIIIWDNHTIDSLKYILYHLGEDINTSEFYIKYYENESVKFGNTKVLYRGG